MTPAQVYDVVVDLTARRVTSVTERPGVEPSITYSEVEAAGLVLTRSAVRRRAAGARDHRSHEAVLRAVRRRLLRDPGARREAADPRRLFRHAAIDHQRLRLAHRAAVRARRSAAARGDRGHRWRRRADRARRSELRRGGRRRAAAAAQADAAGAAAGLERPAGRPHGDVGPVALPRPARSARRHGDLAGRLAGRPRLALRPVSGLPVRDVRAVHGSGRRVAVADLLRHGRIRRRRAGHAARARRRLPGDGGVPARHVRQRQGRGVHDAGRALRVRAQPRRADLAPSGRRQPDLRRPRRRRARGAHGRHHRQLRLSVRLGVHRQRRDRSPRRRHRHRRAEGRGDGAHERCDGRGRHEARHAGRPEPRRRAPRPLLQLPPRPRHRRRRQQRQPGDLPPDDAAGRRRRAAASTSSSRASPQRRRRRRSARTRRR